MPGTVVVDVVEDVVVGSTGTVVVVVGVTGTGAGGVGRVSYAAIEQVPDWLVGSSPQFHVKPLSFVDDPSVTRPQPAKPFVLSTTSPEAPNQRSENEPLPETIRKSGVT